MPRYLLLIRGINVGTRNSLPMADLRGVLEELGCENVRTYIQSGNAIFDTNVAAPKLQRSIEEALERRMGRPIATILRTNRDLKSVLARNPFPKLATNPRFLCVTFLSATPTKAQLAPLQAQSFEPEVWHATGNHIYTWHPEGQGKSVLAAAIGKLPLGRAVTTRNWKTVETLSGMMANA